MSYATAQDAASSKTDENQDPRFGMGLMMRGMGWRHMDKATVHDHVDKMKKYCQAIIDNPDVDKHSREYLKHHCKKVHGIRNKHHKSKQRDFKGYPGRFGMMGYPGMMRRFGMMGYPGMMRRFGMMGHPGMTEAEMLERHRQMQEYMWGSKSAAYDDKGSNI